MEQQTDMLRGIDETNCALADIRSKPPGGLTQKDMDLMLLDMKMTLVALTNLMSESPDPDEPKSIALIAIRGGFRAGYEYTGLSGLISITDDDDDDSLSEVQRLRHIYLRLEAIWLGLRNAIRALQETNPPITPLTRLPKLP